MPKVDNVIKEAILRAAEKYGSQAKVANAVGITPAALSRYLNGKVVSINAATWNILFPVIRDFLPEEYHRTFMGWKSPEEWKKFKEQYPDAYQEAERYHREVDIAEVARTDPRFGTLDKKLNLIKVIIDKLPSGSMETLNAIMVQLLADETKATEKTSKEVSE